VNFDVLMAQFLDWYGRYLQTGVRTISSDGVRPADVIEIPRRRDGAPVG
jgi:hypothetical protein